MFIDICFYRVSALTCDIDKAILSICLSIGLSVCLWCSGIVLKRLNVSSTYGSPIVLVFSVPKIDDDGTYSTPRYDRCNPRKRGVHWFGVCRWCLFASRNVGSLCSRTDSYAGTFGLQINWSKTKMLQVPSSTSSSKVQVADGHVEVVDAFVYLVCMIDSSGGSRRESCVGMA